MTYLCPLSTEKLELFRHLDLEVLSVEHSTQIVDTHRSAAVLQAVEGVHPAGMLAHAKAGLPIHPREAPTCPVVQPCSSVIKIHARSLQAEAKLVESIRASHANDASKVMPNLYSRTSCS